MPRKSFTSNIGGGIPFTCWLLGHRWRQRGLDEFGFGIVNCDRCGEGYFNLSVEGLGDWLKRKVYCVVSDVKGAVVRVLCFFAVGVYRARRLIRKSSPS